MPAIPTSTKDFILDYFKALSGKPKDEALIDTYVADPFLKQHILEAEAAFPNYELPIDNIVAEADTVAVRCTMKATHKGTFAGITATGRSVVVPVMLFYRVADNKIAQFWMLLDVPSLMAQLTA